MKRNGNTKYSLFILYIKISFYTLKTLRMNNSKVGTTSLSLYYYTASATVWATSKTLLSPLDFIKSGIFNRTSDLTRLEFVAMITISLIKTYLPTK